MEVMGSLSRGLLAGELGVEVPHPGGPPAPELSHAPRNLRVKQSVHSVSLFPSLEQWSLSPLPGAGPHHYLAAFGQV